jgi:hydroxymethylpyrimidine pyrophosphatase-like HAD family hydrolase
MVKTSVKALATDYDGTLAEAGRVAPATLAALERLAGRGLHAILVTGRMLDDLARVFPEWDRLDAIVAENGGVLAAGGRARALAGPPPAPLVARLADSGVAPLAIGRAMIATSEPWLPTVTRILAELGLEREIGLNKGAVMLLPPGVDKGTGLAAALAELGVAAAATVGVGDAENDLPFLARCGRAVAVAGALPEVVVRCDLVVPDVAALIDSLLS